MKKLHKTFYEAQYGSLSMPRKPWGSNMLPADLRSTARSVRSSPFNVPLVTDATVSRTSAVFQRTMDRVGDIVEMYPSAIRSGPNDLWPKYR